MSGFDEKIVLRGAVSAHFGERHAEAFGADPRRFRQDLQQIALAKGKAAKAGNRRLLAKKLADFRGVVIHATAPGVRWRRRQHLEPARKRRRRRAGGDDLGDDFQTAQEIGGAVGLGEAGVAVGGCQHDLRDVAGGIEDAEPAKGAQLGGDLGAEPAVGEPQVDDGKVGLVTPAERDRLGDGAGDAAHLVTVLDEDLFGHIGDHQVVFGNQDLEHARPRR